MLRLIHSQTVSGAILVDDIDDGLPNKEVHRLGSNADPKAYDRDGYANKPKQSCYIPRVNATDTSVAGFIDLNLTEKIISSRGKGKILKLEQAGLISTTTLVPADVAAPVLTLSNLDTPGAGDLTITGTTLTSVDPDVTSVIITGTGAITLTAAEIVAGGGTVSATSIVILAALIPGVVTTASSAQVRANQQLTAVVALS